MGEEEEIGQLATFNKLIFIQGHLWLALDNLDIF